MPFEQMGKGMMRTSVLSVIFKHYSTESKKINPVQLYLHVETFNRISEQV